MEKEMDNIFYKNVNFNQSNEVIEKKENTLDYFVIYDEIKKLEKTMEEFEKKRKLYLKLIFTIPAMSITMGFVLSIGVAVFSNLENLTIQNFMETFLLQRNLYSFFIVPTLLGLYYSWAIGSTDYKEEKSILNIASLKLYFLKNTPEILRSREDLNEFFEKLSNYGEEMGKYIKKYKKGNWGMQERDMLAKDNIDTQTFENYLEEQTRKRKLS